MRKFYNSLRQKIASSGHDFYGEMVRIVEINHYLCGQKCQVIAKYVSHRRRLAARLLLAVFLPMLLLASVHHHDLAVVVEDTTCYACQHHLHHNGHLTAEAQHISTCMLCQFLSLPFLTPSAVAAPTPCTAQYAFMPRYNATIVARPQLLNPGRAPPVVSYITPTMPATHLL